LFLDLCGNRIGSQEVNLLEVLQEAIQENSGHDLAGDREDRDPSVIVTWSPVALSLVDVDDGGIFELLWEGLTFPGGLKQLLASSKNSLSHSASHSPLYLILWTQKR